MTPILLTDRQRVELEGAILRSPSARECCRTQALLWLAEGEPVERIADLLHVSRQTVYNWVSRFRERAGLDLRDRLGDAPRPGRPRTGGGASDPLIAAVIDSDPRALGYRSTVWTAPLLSRYLRERHQIAVCDRTVSRAIARLGIRWKRPRHRLARRPDTWRQAKGGSSAACRAAPEPCC
ncbi:MAG TPA: helix-turn-helix domain-containing protein [Gemmataceae bacterium]|nr:helix-turn-helix domain-containing protein [Gemmataceae bacterium]